MMHKGQGHGVLHNMHGLEDTTSSWAPDEFVFSPQVPPALLLHMLLPHGIAMLAQRDPWLLVASA